MTDSTTAIGAAWQDTSRPPRERAAALLSEMTLDEKVHQLGSTWPNAANASGDVAPMQESQQQAAAFDEAIRGGIGQLTRPFGTLPVDPAEGMRQLAGFQRAVVAANRFGIPALAHEECLTGFTAWKATVYPTAIAWAATFDPGLIREMAATIGRDMAGVGVHQGLSPVLDVVRDYRWGRVEETLGEDPFLVGEIACSYVEGLQSAGVIATLKHFAGYSASRGARNHAPVSMGRRELADVVLPPFEKAVTKAGVRSVMNAYTDTDGVPAAVDSSLLSELLRDTWNFEGTVVSDYWSVPFVATMHRVAEGNADAARATLLAGIDVELPHTLGYESEYLAGDEASVAAVDRSALRVLTQKAELGLLDADWSPAEPVSDGIDLDPAGNRDLARRIAEQSIVLLANDGTLPLIGSPAEITVLGPGADDAGCFFGCYSFPNHVMPNHPDLPIGVEAPTVLEVLTSEFPEAVVRHASAVDVVGGDTSGLPAALDLLDGSDLVVLVVGDRSGMFGHGTSGEGCDVTDLTLPGHQEELVAAVLDRATSPVVLVVLSGRPYAVGRHADRAAATLQVFFPGEEGARAITNVLTGRVDPSGRLPVQIPGDAASAPGTYLAAPLALRSDGVSSLDPSPAFPFGHGLAYTDFTFASASASATSIPTDGSVVVSAVIRNTGSRWGTAVPQLYLSDPVASVVRPVRQLIGFTRVELAPGEAAEVSFTVHADLVGFTGVDHRRRVEPGRIDLVVASSAADPGAAVSVDLVGPVRHVDHTRAMSTESRIVPLPDPAL